MAKVRMRWDYINEDLAIIVYMQFIKAALWSVKLMKVEKGDKQPPPEGPAWKSYQANGPISKDDVLKDALERANKWLAEEAATTRKGENTMANNGSISVQFSSICHRSGLIVMKTAEHELVYKKKLDYDEAKNFIVSMQKAAGDKKQVALNPALWTKCVRYKKKSA